MLALLALLAALGIITLPGGKRRRRRKRSSPLEEVGAEEHEEEDVPWMDRLVDMAWAGRCPLEEKISSWNDRALFLDGDLLKYKLVLHCIARCTYIPFLLSHLAPGVLVKTY